jgi:hypothetical protein
MEMDERDAAKAAGRPRTRLVPPRLGEVERRTRPERGAEPWTRGLRATQRRRLYMLLGNAALLGALVGLPFVRGHYRALATQRAHAAFLGCLYRTEVAGGLGEFKDEAEYFAEELARADPALPRRCIRELRDLSESPALFVLPSLKAAEARVREAQHMVQSELDALAIYKPGARMPDRPLRALALLRSTVRALLLASGTHTEQAELPPSLGKRPALSAPARLPLYAAPDAALSLWGDDQVLRVVALDATGLSYLEAQSGKPFSRARLVRPTSLRGFVRGPERDWLLWATAEERCRERSDACFSKSTRIAAAPTPLLELPETRTLAAHMAGRADRSLAASPGGLLLVTRTDHGQSALSEFIVPPEFATAAELPALSASRSWTTVVDEAVVLAARERTLVLGVTRKEGRAELLELRPGSSLPITSLAGGSDSWLATCAGDTAMSFAFGDGQHVRVGSFVHTADGLRAHVWPELTLAVEHAIDPQHPGRDRVRSVCRPEGAVVVAREANDQLTAIVCRDLDAPCRKLHVASGVDHFSVLASGPGALIAYASAELPQVRVQTIEQAEARLAPAHIPGACWTRSGLCSAPNLARLGSRILLVAPDKTDLLALESSDEGKTFRTPVVW